MEVIAFYAGSFDPVTKGHEDIARRAVKMFDRLIIGVGTNSEKKPFFSLEERLRWLRRIFADCPQIDVVSYEGLTIDACRRCGATVLVRGARSAADWEAEQNIAFVNHCLAPEIETLLIPATDDLMHVSSTNVREFLKYGRSVKDFVPEAIEGDFK